MRPCRNRGTKSSWRKSKIPQLYDASYPVRVSTTRMALCPKRSQIASPGPMVRSQARSSEPGSFESGAAACRCRSTGLEPGSTTSCGRPGTVVAESAPRPGPAVAEPESPTAITITDTPSLTRRSDARARRPERLALTGRSHRRRSKSTPSAPAPLLRRNGRGDLHGRRHDVLGLHEHLVGRRTERHEGIRRPHRAERPAVAALGEVRHDCLGDAAPGAAALVDHEHRPRVGRLAP